MFLLVDGVTSQSLMLSHPVLSPPTIVQVWSTSSSGSRIDLGAADEHELEHDEEEKAESQELELEQDELKEEELEQEKLELEELELELNEDEQELELELNEDEQELDQLELE